MPSVTKNPENSGSSVGLYGDGAHKKPLQSLVANQPANENEAASKDAEGCSYDWKLHNPSGNDVLLSRFQQLGDLNLFGV